ncbi:hypothetical protein GCM10009530_67590 [Microbispora corallina]|uniref:STAS domain-containing protein n=1 Tax=Microbispora corallina TaxID=83302 RepID=A0ABQ4G9K5_9ACTN|nr:STAS domain-containing protein [Microbispora corallina]GIH43760.1 hypothetical protein Mco01_67600 [Microbispora corallina]
MLRIQITSAEPALTVALSGDLDMAEVPEFRAFLTRTLAVHPPGHVRVDLAEVGFLDCAGARSLLWADARVREWGGTATFARPSQPVLRLLRLLELDRTLLLRGGDAATPTPAPTAVPRPVPRPVPTPAPTAAGREVRPGRD